MNDWFEWNGIRCTEYGMHVLGQPTIISASERVEYVDVPGRSGSLTLLEDGNIYDDITLGCTCIIDDPYQKIGGTNVSVISRICGWLTGGGRVTFANRQEGYYEARISNQISFDKIVRGNPHMSFQVQFRCHPFLYLHSGLSKQTVSKGTPGKLINEGNIPSRPLIKLTGNAEGSIMCGTSTMIVENFTGVPYIMLDCEAKLAYKGEQGNPADPLTLLGTRVTGDWLEIPTGTSHLTLTGGIAQAVVVPRWRCV